MNDITVIVLTYNEEKHIERCLRSINQVATRVCVVDSFSTDNTEEIAKKNGVDFFQNPWKNYATQFTWALNNCAINTEWVMRIDADEYLEPKLVESINAFKNHPENNNAAYFRRKVFFMGRPIKHGFFYPSLMLRLWRNGTGTIEDRWMDEHIVVENVKSVILNGDLDDENLNDITWWTHKHTGYAIREAYDIIKSKNEVIQKNNLTGQAKIKRFFKNNIYNKLPSVLRGFMYFFYRYIIGFGFLDGKSGFYFHFLQAFWYRTFVDAKLYELEIMAKNLNISTYELLKQRKIL